MLDSEYGALPGGGVANGPAAGRGPDAPRYVQACLNGARDLAEHPRLTADPGLLAAEAADCAAAGAASVHVHPKDEDGRDTLEAAHVARVITAIHTRCPGLAVGVTTGAWAEPDPTARTAAIEGWTVLPDFASVNWHEPGAEDVARALADRGVGIEAGIWNHDALQAWAGSPVRNACCRVLVELPATPDEAELRRLADGLAQGVMSLTGQPILLHGEDASAWPAIDLAIALRLQTRVGLEDTLRLRSGRIAPDNASLVRDAVQPCPGLGSSRRT